MTGAPWVGAVGVATATGSALWFAMRWGALPDRVDRAIGDPSPPIALVRAAWRRVIGATPVLLAVERWRERRDRRARLAQLPEFVDGVVRSARVGMSLQLALRDGAEVVGPPILDDLAAVERDVALGIPLSSALARWSARVGSDDLDLFITACVLGAEMGRGTADALDGVAGTLADRRDVAAEAHAAAAQARASAVLLAALPVVVVGLLSFVDPSTLTVLLTTPAGWGCLVAALALDATGLWWMHRLIGSVA